MLAPRDRPEHRNAAEAAASLHELASLERATAHVLAGWIVKVADLDEKVALGRLLWQAMERATRLRARVGGLTRAGGGARPTPTGWRDLMRHVDAAPDGTALRRALDGVVRPGLAALYRAHLASTDPVGDAESVRLIESLLPALDAETAAVTGAAGPDDPFARETRRLWEARHGGPDLGEDGLLWAPLDRVPRAVRREGLAFCEPGSLGILTVDSVREPEDVARFLHADLDEEYTTLELMARNSYEHPDMPWAFHGDMARQASDEARHAVLMRDLLRARGRDHGDFPVSTSSYDGLYQFGPVAPGSRKELLWRMLIRQTFMEGLALDSLAHDIRRRAGAGQDDIVHALEYILTDEVFHVASGVRWTKHLLGDEPRAALQERYEALTHFTAEAEAGRARWVEANLDKALAEVAILEEGNRRRGGPPEHPLNRAARLAAGQDELDILQVLSWGYATEKAEER